MAQIGAISNNGGIGIQTTMLYPGIYKRTQFSVRATSDIVPRNENKRPCGLTRVRAISALEPDSVGACLMSDCGLGCFRTSSMADVTTLRTDYYSMDRTAQASYMLNILNNKLPKADYVINGHAFCEKCFAKAYHTTVKHLRELKNRIRDCGSR